VYGAVVATLNFAWPRLKEWKDGRTAVFRALQGEKEAISEIAMQVVDTKWDKKVRKSKAFRERLIRALSMAFVLESSDRAKAYVVAAFYHIGKLHRIELIAQLESIENIYKKYYAIVKDEEFRVKRLEKLSNVIKHLQ
jgi:Zn-dependent oligopeptidase